MPFDATSNSILQGLRAHLVKVGAGAAGEDDFLARLSKRKETINGLMTVPYKAMRHEAGDTGYKSHMDQAHDNLKRMNAGSNTKQAMKLGFLLKCAEAGMSLEQIESKLDVLLEKAAVVDMVGAGSALGQVAASGVGLGHGLLNTLKDIGMTTAVGAPILAGGLAGYGLGKWKSSEDPETVKRQELSSEYLRLADEARRKALLRKMQIQNPGSLIQLS